MDLACTDHLQRRPVIQLGIRSIEPSTEIRNAASHQTQRPRYLLKRYQLLVDSCRIRGFMSRLHFDANHASELRSRKSVNLSHASDIESSAGLVDQFSGAIGVSKKLRPLQSHNIRIRCCVSTFVRQALSTVGSRFTNPSRLPPRSVNGGLAREASTPR